MAVDQFDVLDLGRVLSVDSSLSCLKYTEGRLCLCLDSNDQSQASVDVSFDDALFFSVADEGDRVRSLSTINNIRSSRVFVGKKTRLIRWFLYENYDIRSKSAIQHYVVLTIDDWIDVLALSDPTVGARVGPAKAFAKR